MIGLALSGGGSRAIAFHLGCLRALNDLGLLDKVGVLSTISGGSVIGAYYAYTPQKSFREFDADICRFLRNGFQKSILMEMAKPGNLILSVVSLVASNVDMLSSKLLDKEHSIPQYPTLTDMLYKVLKRDLFSGLKMSSARRNNIDVVIGACELITGSAFRFGNDKSGDWRHGAMANWDVDLALAVSASAAYPILLPAFDRKWKFMKNGKDAYHRVLITDGGVYDNLGMQVLEPGRNPNVSIHSFPCNYLIICNAGHGQDAGSKMSSGFLPRVSRSFEIVHRRVQDSAMHRLHQLKQAGQIKGFAMPYLGQQDTLLPWPTTNLVPRSDVVNYPTDFAPMSNEWIEKLAGRGEQLTRGLVDYYLSEIL